MVPLGLLYVGRIIEDSGYKVKIYDPYIEINSNFYQNNNYNELDKLIKEFNPNIIGFGGIATSYGMTKDLSRHIKQNYPDILQIAGGALSSVYRLLLEKSYIDVVFHGEAEESLPVFLEKIKKGESYYDLLGISFKLNENIKRNPLQKQIEDLDIIPYPAYNLVNINDYLHSIDKWLDAYKVLLNHNPNYQEIREKIGNKKYFFPIIKSRGCTHKCLFCYRHMKGFRQHSVDYVISHMKFLNKSYGIQGFQFSDELFNFEKKWVLEFCERIKAEKLDIFYLVGGARIDNIDKETIKALKDTGCIEINYGQESGSDKILKEYRKGVTVSQNKEITKLTMDMGLNCPVQIVIGSPGETQETIKETINLLKDLNAFQYSLNYLIPLPETPIWKYVEERGLIRDVEGYLFKVAEYGGEPLINLTSVPDKNWKRWKLIIRKEMRLYYLKKNKKYVRYFFEHFLLSISIFIYPFMPKKIYDITKVILKKIII